MLYELASVQAIINLDRIESIQLKCYEKDRDAILSIKMSSGDKYFLSGQNGIDVYHALLEMTHPWSKLKQTTRENQ